MIKIKGERYARELNGDIHNSAEIINAL